MLADEEFCHRCSALTKWEPIRGGSRLKCAGCGDVFPCRHDCQHLDCAAARADGGAQDDRAEYVAQAVAGAPEVDCPDHWHCDPARAPHLCDKPDRSAPCPSCGKDSP